MLRSSTERRNEKKRDKKIRRGKKKKAPRGATTVRVIKSERSVVCVCVCDMMISWKGGVCGRSSALVA